jgi:diaminopimelate epimerase
MNSLDVITIEFTKIEGAGNDFVLIDNRENKYSFSLPTLARILCHRHFGIGSDGLIVLESSTVADIKMRFLNPDGSEGAMCGNGGRCVAHYAILKQTKSKVSIEALDFVYNAEGEDNNIKLQMKNPTELKFDLKFSLQNEIISSDFINTGSDHLVVDAENLPVSLGNRLEEIDIKTIGRFLRYHKYFHPRGTNVNFIEKVGEREINIRTYERGVEDETLACGTGSVASAIVAALKYSWKPLIKVHTRSGSILTINFQYDSKNISDVSIMGPAKIVFTGKLKYSLIKNEIV